MSLVSIRVDPQGFRGLEEKLKKIEARIPQAIALGLNDGGDKVRTQVQRALKQQTNVKAYSSITSRMRTVRAYGGSAPRSGVGPIGIGSLTYQIVATGKGIPIKEFPVRLTLRGVDADTWGVDHLFQRSFGIKGQGIEGFRARRGASRFPIRKLFGPALPKELGRGIVPSVFVLSTGLFVPPAIVRQLGRVLR